MKELAEAEKVKSDYLDIRQKTEALLVLLRLEEVKCLGINLLLQHQKTLHFTICIFKGKFIVRVLVEED